MSGFVPCPTCRRHVRAASECPFCVGSDRPSALAAALVTSALMIAGCNDPKPTDPVVPATSASTTTDGTPSATATATVTATASATPSATATTTATASATASALPSATAKPSATASATAKPSATVPRPAMRYGIMPAAKP